jgi:hypothetical protein
MNEETRKNKIITWILCHKLINIEGLEREAMIPRNFLRLVLKGIKKLPSKHLENLELVLKDYGYKP